MEERALSLLENSYADYIMHKISIDKLCKNIKLALETLPFADGRKTFDVQVYKNSNMRDFFALHIFPTLDENQDICSKLTGDSKTDGATYKEMLSRWKSFSNWVLELDSLLFDRNELNFTPRELTALTLHEIGHVIYSGRPVEMFYRAFKENQLRMKLEDKLTQKAMHMIYMIPLGIACLQRRWVNGKNEIHMEIIADKTVFDYGYGDDMVSALDKIISKFGSIEAPDGAAYNEIDSSVQWCNRNIQDVIVRKDRLKDELFYTAIKNKSSYIKAATIIALDKIGFALREKYTGAVTEATIELLSDPELLTKYTPVISVLESAKFDRVLEMYRQQADYALEAFGKGNGKKSYVLPSQYEVDAISVEIDNMRSHHDRIFVLDLIYDLLARIDAFEEGISPDPALVRKWQPKIDDMRDELSRYRKATLEKKNFPAPSTYKCFVKLPEVASDYEG